ncbi:disease resistance protein At4g27190-like [Abrus precatorius]|uniref:Disease resistance protein At4g27190-like n=1 Tax=Abrus precatorius TaxID=3816 RepID=A0A8B8K1H8_ABRPR|nr:disease resistance protein At4g27190-like [Abrus precatorius]
MEEIGAKLSKSIFDRLMNCAIAELRYVCCFSDIVEDMEKEKKAWEESVKEEIRKGNNIRTNVTSWLKETEGLIKDTQIKKTCFFGWCPNCKWRYSKGKQLAKKKKETERLLKSGNVGISPHLPGVEYHSSQYYVYFDSRKPEIKELLDALKDDNNFTVGLQGMGGAGKTTLAIKVAKELRQLQQFHHHVIYTTVSYTPDIRRIQDDIAAPLGLDIKDKSESERRGLLWSRLTGDDKILLILDDVWNPINFDEIGIPREDNHKGCRIFLITREMRVCQSMGCEKTIQLGVLSEEDAWTLFKKHANLSDSSSKRLLDKGRDITKECKGLPVAIAPIASSLRDQESVEVWNSTLKSLQKGVGGDSVDTCLRRSYDNLKDDEAKKLFRLCSMFPEDEELSDEILTRFCIGVRLFGEVDNKYDEARDQVVTAKIKLVNSCLLVKAGKQSVKMHDLVRDVALRIANEEIQAVNVSNKNQKLLLEKRKNIKYLLCEGKSMDVLSCKFDSSKLEILNVYMDEDRDEDDCVEVPNSFFENMTELRVLHLSFKTWRHVSLSLPQSFQSLTNIRSLLLESLLLEDFSVLKNLQNLETLDLVGFYMDELPREIAKLEKLRVLRLRRGVVKNLNSIKVIERCSSLEELYIVVSYRRVIDTAAMHEKITFPAFQRYIMKDNRIVMDESLSKCVAWTKIDAIFSEVTFKHLVQTSELLHLREIEGEWRNLIPDIVTMDRGMNDLIELYLSESPQLRCLIDTTRIDSHRRSFFSKLIELRLRAMDNFEELCNGPFPFDFLNNLQGLVISDCINLRSILFKSKLNLCYLKTIDLYKCPKLVSLFQLSTCQSLLLLEELSIHDCEQLKNIIVRVNEELKNEIVGGENDNKSLPTRTCKSSRGKGYHTWLTERGAVLWLAKFH